MKEYIVGENLKAKLILTGQWLYDNILPKIVRIYELNFDFYFEQDRGYYDEDEKPFLNKDGLQYVITWNDSDSFSFKSDPSVGGLTLDKAIDTAEKITQQKIKWNS
jgi:hypothetical protein